MVTKVKLLIVSGMEGEIEQDSREEHEDENDFASGEPKFSFTICFDSKDVQGTVPRLVCEL